MFSYVSPEQRVPQDHPLRPVREMVDTILMEMSGRFARLYSERGRPSIAPERLLVFDVSEGWKPLCNFLGVAVPEQAFPRSNDPDAFWELVKKLEN